MKQKGKRQAEHPASGWLNAMCEVLKGGVLAGVTAILSLLACAVLVSLGVLPVGGMKGAVLAVCVLGSLVGGAYGVKKVGTLPLLVGPGVGLVLFLLLLTAGLLVYDGASVEQGGAGILLACLCGGAIPGLLGRRPKKKRRR